MRSGPLSGLGSALVSALVLAAVVLSLSVAYGAVSRWGTRSYVLSHSLLFAFFGACCGAVGAIASSAVRRVAPSPGGDA